MQCDSTISIEKEGRNSEKASVPSIVQISSTHFHSIFPFHFASSNPSFFVDPIASTISNKRFFFFIIQEFSNKHWNSIGSDGVVSISFELDHDTSFDLANDLHKLAPFSNIPIRGISSLDFSTRFTPSTGCESAIETLEQRSNPLRDTPNRSSG